MVAPATLRGFPGNAIDDKSGGTISNTSLYRHFASDGTLLYVGISLSWPNRTKAHRRKSRWFDDVARVEIENFKSREAALEAERAAIIRERPKFNIVHMPASQGDCTSNGASKKRRETGDPLLDRITGPHAIVGPCLIYRGDTISVMIAHGDTGHEGELIEVVLGEYCCEELPAWTNTCDTVINLRRGNQITMPEARQIRDGIVRKLKRHLSLVKLCDSDIALAQSNAALFPSEKSVNILNEINVEQERASKRRAAREVCK